MHSYISTDHVIHEMLSMLLLLIIIEYVIVRIVCILWLESEAINIYALQLYIIFQIII